MNVTLGAVNTAKSFPLISYRSAGANFNCNDFVRAKITSSTNLQLSADSMTCGTVATSVVEWQVVQYLDANVQSGDVTFTAGAPSQTAALAPAVNTARSWLIYSYDGTPDAIPDIGQYLVRGRLTNSNTLTFDRNNTGTVAIDLTWYLVEFTDGTTVQNGSQPFTATENQKDVTLGASVDLSNSIATAGGDYQRGGRSNYAADDVPGVGWFNLDLTSPTNLRITRGATGGGTATADVGWFVVSFPGCCSLATTEVAGSTITVTAAAEFEMVFNRSAGGGIEQFYDLAESSTRDAVHDLVGGTATGKTLHGDGLGVGGISYNTTQSVLGTKLDLLESTATRTRVRQEAFYTQEGGALVLAGAKGFGDYSIYGSGRTALRWNVRATSPVTYTYHDLDFNVHLQAAGALSSWVPFSQTDGSFPNAGTEQFFVVTNEVAGARTDFLDILYRNWTTANGYLATADMADWFADAPNERGNPFWEDNPGATIPAGTAGDTWNFLTYFKPTNFANNADPAVTTRSTDYRTHPAGEVTINAGKGSQWSDPAENTAAGTDWFNESEAVYPLELSQTLGLDFTLDGATTKRYSPFFKIRGWRSFVEAPVVTLNTGTGAVSLRKDLDYKAAVKPVSRAHWASTLNWHCTMQSTTACDSASLDLGTGVASSTGGAAATPGRFGNGLLFTANNDNVTAGATDFNPSIGAVDFWYQPRYASAATECATSFGTGRRAATPTSTASSSRRRPPTRSLSR